MKPEQQDKHGTRYACGENVNRFELIDNTGRVITHIAGGAFDVKVLEQDNLRTIKVFVDATLRDNECQKLRERLARADATAKARGAIIRRLEHVLTREMCRDAIKEAYERGRITGYQDRAAEESTEAEA